MNYQPATTFSPPAWGWSGCVHCSSSKRAVFPTRVGMVRGRGRRTARDRGFPHPRGDGPRTRGSWSCCYPFSPPAWGWSGSARQPGKQHLVFPTRVGMVRDHVKGCRARPCFPHPRGDGPLLRCRLGAGLGFSPPAWGWSAFRPGGIIMPAVFPTRVGMVRHPDGGGSGFDRFPHPRGDGPIWQTAHDQMGKFSPPAWGWSETAPHGSGGRNVFPTRVGMVRRRAVRLPRRCSFPHPRGDGPVHDDGTLPEVPFSPPAWGWSVIL